MASTRFSNHYSGNSVNRPEPSNKELPTSSRNFSVPNAAHQSPVILSPPVTPILEPNVFDGNPAHYRSFINAFDVITSFNFPESSRKLFYLLRYTNSLAHSLVKGRQYIDNALG